MAFPLLSLSIPSFSTIGTSFFPIPKPSRLSITKKIKKPYYLAPNKVVSCNATNNRNRQNIPSNTSNRFDRRDVLVGLGGLYGAANLAGNDSFALAAPITPPDLTVCHDAEISDNVNVYCCPPTTAKIIDFNPPSFSRLRYRPTAHLVDANYLVKFTEAMKRMKALGDDDPRNFMQQANVHCAYCNGAYDQVGFPDTQIQIHYNWLFFPFHRLFLYFFERILGKLIDDPDFAIPFWNWDAPVGMTIPAIYVNPDSPLYDEKRNVDHQPPALVNLDYSSADEVSSKKDQITSNLKVMYRQMVSGSKSALLFHGGKYLAGDEISDKSRMGTIENMPHISVHKWCGDQRKTYREDMGNFYSAGRDPLFYAHHANVDRMWSIWKQLPGDKRVDFPDTDWLDASFLFYDENANLVRAKVRDCLETKLLGYSYEPVDIPWLKTKPTPRKFAKKGGKPRGQAQAAEIKNKNVLSHAFPIFLDKIVSIEIPRPKKSRSKLEKQNEEEVLVIESIQLERNDSVKFDVYINVEDDESPIGPQDSEFAGSFSNLPHSHNQSGKKYLKTNLFLAITDLLEDLDVENDDNLVVTLVPKEGKGKVTVGNIKIDYIR